MEPGEKIQGTVQFDIVIDMEQRADFVDTIANGVLMLKHGIGCLLDVSAIIDVMKQGINQS